MLALIEIIPYLAFTVAAMLLAFVAGEALYKKFLSIRFSAIGAKTMQTPKAAPAPAPVQMRQNESSERVSYIDQPLNVRIDSGANPPVMVADSERQTFASADSGQNSAASAELQPLAEKIVTSEMVAPPQSDRQPPVPIGGEDGTVSSAESSALDEGNLCNDVVAIRRDPSVRVFDAVVAPSERKASAA